MKKSLRIIGLLLTLVLCLSFALTGCKEEPAGGTPSQPTNNPTASTPSQPNEPGEELKISVVPETMEIYAGDPFDIKFGVTVNNAEANLFVSDDEGFDADVPGTYTITYTAKLGDKQTTATRTVTVLEALSNLTLEVVKNNMTAGKWEGVLMNFQHNQYMELSADYTTTEALTGVFKNTSDQPIVVTIGGKMGEAAIIDANGVVIEGRDGANGRLVNAENPIRVSAPLGATLTVDGEEVVLAENFAKVMVIPAGGYAIVVQTGAFGEGFDFDGRGFLCQSVIHQVGNVIRLYWTDTNEELTQYVNQKPTVSGNNKVLAVLGDTAFKLEEAIIAGLVAIDDNGTFINTDDVKIEEFIIVNDGGFDINKPGEFTITLSVTDGELTTEFTRVVEVKADGVGILTVGENKFYVDMERVKFNEEVTKAGNIAFLIYNKEFTGALLENGWGVAFVMDEYGKLVRIYDGASAKYHDAENPDGIEDSSKVTEKDYMKEAFASLQDGETLLVAINNGDQLHRSFAANNKVIGAMVSGLDMQFKVTSTTITIGDKTFTAEDGKWAYNTEITATDAAKYSMIIFDKKYTGEVALNGYGAAIVLDQYGVLVKIYDAANMGFWTAEGKSTSPLTFTAANYATVAFSELQEGETLIVFPNDGDKNPARGWALGLRNAGTDKPSYCGQVATLTGFEFAEKPADNKTITINGKTFTAEEGKWAYNTEIATADAAKYSMIIYDKNYTGTVALNGYGAAIVLDQYGKLVKIYDAANMGFWTAEGKSTSPLTFTAANYATVAFSELQEGETLIVFPNDGDKNPARGWALGLRNAGTDKPSECGQVATLTGFTFKKEN